MSGRGITTARTNWSTGCSCPGTASSPMPTSRSRCDVIILVTASRGIDPVAHRLVIRGALGWIAGFRDGGFRDGVIDQDHELWDGLAAGGDTVCHEVAVEDFGWK